MRNYGMPTLLELPKIEDCAKLCAELGLDFIEFNMNLPQYQTDRLNVSTFSEIAERYGVYYTIHLDENLIPCDFNNKIAAACTQTVLETIEIAKQLNVSILNMHLHSGIYFTLPGNKVFLFDKYESEYLRKLIAFRNTCEIAIGGADIKICVENTGVYNIAFMRKSLDILLESSAFALTFDIGHNAAANFSDEPVIMKYTDRLSHMHIHDFTSDFRSRAESRQFKFGRDHLTLGDGELDLAKYFALAQANDCRMVIEVKTVDGLRQSVDYIKNFHT